MSSVNLLELSETCYRKLFETAPDGVLIIDAVSEKVIDVNPSFLHLLGYSSFEIKGKVIGEIFQGFKAKRFLQSSPLSLETKKGRKIDVEIISSIFTVDEQEFVQCNIRDITERKRAEEEVQRIRKTLEMQLSHNEQQLAQEDLAQSKRLSDIGTLAATVAHELRNPLAAINLAMQNIRRKKQDLPIDRHLDSIEKKVLEGEQIITNLLFCSRLRLPQYETIDIGQILEGCISQAQKKHILQKVKITEKSEKNKGKVILDADPSQIKELFTNLLNNAYDAVLHREKPQIMVGLQLKNEATIEIYFKDNGEGIPRENIKRVLDPFFTTKAKGTGLGLTICQQIAKLHHGELHIESESSKGTTVTILLPNRNTCISSLISS